MSDPMPSQAMLQAMAKTVGRTVREHVSNELAPLREEIARLRARLDAAEQRGISYAGAYQRAQAYRRGDAVTHAGSLWIACRSVEPTATPGQSDAWQLAVKSGQAGKDAK